MHTRYSYPANVHKNSVLPVFLPINVSEIETHTEQTDGQRTDGRARHVMRLIRTAAQ